MSHSGLTPVEIAMVEAVLSGLLLDEVRRLARETARAMLSEMMGRCPQDHPPCLEVHPSRPVELPPPPLV